MSEVVYSGVVSKLVSVIRAFPADTNTLMILEKLPTTWIEFDRHRPDSGLRFAAFDPSASESFADWGRGRIFNQVGELRWEETATGFQMVYIGQLANLPGLTADNILDLDATDRREDCTYYLWGQRMSAKQLQDIKWSDPNETDIFVELQTPRLLRYPVEAEAGSRLKLQVVEYYDQKTSQLLIYRFKGVTAV